MLTLIVSLALVGWSTFWAMNRLARMAVPREIEDRDR